MRFLTTAALALISYGAVSAEPTQVAFAKLFDAKASWHLPCVESHDGKAVPVGEFVCTIDHPTWLGATKRGHFSCTGVTEPAAGTDLAQAFEPRTLVATSDALWSADDPTTIDIKTPPLLARHPKDGVRRENHGDHDSCCTGDASAPCKPCPPEYRGVEYTTAQLDKSWCVRSHPWGSGGAPTATVFCVASDGRLTGIASYKRESDTAELRCGTTIDPKP